MFYTQLESAKADRNSAAVAEAEAELTKLGGRASYQAASELTTSRHRTSKWVFSVLTKLELRPAKGQPPLKVLEVAFMHCKACKLQVSQTQCFSSHASSINTAIADFAPNASLFEATRGSLGGCSSTTIFLPCPQLLSAYAYTAAIHVMMCSKASHLSCTCRSISYVKRWKAARKSIKSSSVVTQAVGIARCLLLVMSSLNMACTAAHAYSSS